jgi:hypothetical protein
MKETTMSTQTNDVLAEHLPKVVCAACKFSNGLVIASVRHYDQVAAKQIQAMFDAGIMNNKDVPIQGFLDKNGKFLTREEAWFAAVSNDQINQDSRTCFGTLYSENLY